MKVALMKITFVTPAPSLCGGYRAIAAYADQLRRRGHHVHIIARLTPPLSFPIKLRSVLRGRGLPKLSQPDTTYLDLVGIPVQLINYPRSVTDSDVPDSDVVIGTWWETAEWVAQLSPSKGAKVYFIQDHEIFPDQPLERVAATWRMPLHKIVVSEWLGKLAWTEYGDPDVSLVSYGVDHQQFWAPPRGKNRVPTVGVVYTLASRKTCHIALDAFRIASKRFPELRLVAFGTEEIAPQVPLPPHTEFRLRPPQAELREFYAQCDVWLFSSNTEGFGLPILEAMACRTPVIGTPAGAAPELIPDGGGILVARDDPNDMARAIEQMITLSEPDWMSRSELACDKASRYNWDNAAQRFEAALQTAIEKQNRR
jgi:glycosyltransferase involved in cell wall biosynthesis